MARQFLCTSTEPVVQTRAGKLRGFRLDGIYTFQGIRYAQAKRFLPPSPVSPWEGVKDALSYGPISPLLDTPSPQGEIMIPHLFWPENENCQYLNIWSKSLDKAAKLPVMVWLHGGGYSAGSSIEQVAYIGDNLAQHGDVVVVTLNHRLNILGYCDLSSFGDKYKNSGNAGMADIVEALKWVKDNIAAFGGDPDKVTIFGQSGGGGKVTTLGQIPEAAGLYHRAVVMSGVLTGLITETRDDRPVIRGILEELSLKESEVEKLETLPFVVLSRALARVGRKLYKQGINLGMRWAPVPNDYYVGDPLAAGFTEFAKKVPTMVGSCIAEFSFGVSTAGKNKLSPEERRAKVAERYGEHTDQAIELFKKAYPGKNETDLLALDTVFRPGVLEYVEKKSAESTAPVYSYLFALEFDYDDGKPAWHCADIPFVFHNTDKVAVCNIQGVTEKLEEQVCGAYINFAKTGNPGHPSLPDWPAFTGAKKTTMIFDRQSRVGIDYDSALIALAKKALPSFSPGEQPPAEEGEDEGRAWLY
ncbi:MAG: carboxylesterase family protein [Treponema sp.]|jgi:para-nitrobenzyl esterase|nr:carboxylesterase family protein [Treponema sp.]